MACNFTLSHDGTTYRLFAEKVGETDRLETWRVASQLDKNSFIALSNDRPLLHRERHYTAPYKWTVLEGDPQYRKMVVQITTYLEYYIKGLWRPPKKGKAELKAGPEHTQGKLF
jgi:hypothetical protein